MTLSQEDFFHGPGVTRDVGGEPEAPFSAAPESREGRREPLSLDATKMRQRKLGEFCWAATVSRPDICSFGEDCLAYQLALWE